MTISRTAAVLALVGAFAAASLAFGLTAGGSATGGGNNQLLRATLAPSVPADPAFHGITPGGVPWVVAGSSVRLTARGQLDVEIAGLVIPSLGTPGPVTSVSASLLCGPDATTTPAATTGTVPLSSSGDAEIEARLTLPATCLAPIVVVHPNGGVTHYIAITGWKS